jgi:hypothetical protein
MASVTTDAAKWDRKMARFALELKRSMPSLVNQAARSCAIQYAYVSQPFGFTDPEKFRKTIEAEVTRVFITRQNASGVYLLIRDIDPIKAEAYWAAHKKGSTRRAADILNSVNIPRSTDVSLLKNARTGKNAHVPKKIKPRSLVTQGEQRAIINRQVKLAGFAKAGWVNAGRSLGGRLRTNTTSATGQRTTTETIPAWIRAVANKYKTSGGSTTGSTETGAYAEIYTSVRHAQNALSDGAKTSATEQARTYFVNACKESIQILKQKIFAA